MLHFCFGHQLCLIPSIKSPTKPIPILKNLNDVTTTCTTYFFRWGEYENIRAAATTTKIFKYGVFSGTYFSVFGLNLKIYLAPN